jgi:hypothetical protein
VTDETRDDKVKVVDRRWFNADGELKEPAEPASPSSPAPPPTAPAPPNPPPAPPNPPPAPHAEVQAPAAGVEDAAEAGGPPSEVGLLDLVDFLAQQAVALLSGQIPGRGRDPAMARFFIDLLGVVKERTAGRLTPEETRYLEDVLYQLRSLFVAPRR